MIIDLPDEFVRQIRAQMTVEAWGDAQSLIRDIGALLPPPPPLERLVYAGWTRVTPNHVSRRIGNFEVAVHGQPEGGYVIEFGSATGLHASAAEDYALGIAAAIDQVRGPW